MRGSQLTPQQIESHVANGGNPEDLVGQQTGLRQEQVQAIGEAVTAYNNKEIDIYQFESRLKQTAGLSTDQTDLVVNRVFNDNQVAITRQQNAVDIESSYRDWETDRKSTRLNSSHSRASRMPSSA